MPRVSDFVTFVPLLFLWIFNVKTCSSQRQPEPDRDNMSTAGYDDYDDSTLDYSQYHAPCEKAVNRQFRLWFIPLFCSVVCVLGLAGNGLVVFTFVHFRRLKTMTDVYLLNLAFADLLVALLLPFWAANCLAEWALGLAACKAMYTLNKVTSYSSIFFLSCISVDRYFVIAMAVTAQRHRATTALLSKLSSAAVWAGALVLSVPEMHYTTVRHATCTPYWPGNASLSLQVIVQSTQISLGFFAPLLVMTFCYGAIVRTLHRSRSFERERALRVILAVAVTFLVCQAPHTLVLFRSTLDAALGFNEDCDFQKALHFAGDVTEILAVFRCCLNPLVYGFIGVKFRLDLLKLMRWAGLITNETHRRHSRSSVADPETTTTFSP